MVPVGENGHQAAAADRGTDHHVGQARDANPGQRQLQHGFGIVGGDVAADMDDADAIVGVEGPAPQRRQAGDPQAVVLLQVVRRARRAVALQIGRRRADDAFQVADAPCYQR